MKKSLKNFWSDQIGQDLIEYVLMTAFVAVAAMAVMPGVFDSIASLFAKTEAMITGAKYIAPPKSFPDAQMIRIVCAAIAAGFLGAIVLRRKKNAD